MARVLPARQGDEIRPAFSFEFIDRASAHDFNFDISEADSKIIMDFFRDIGNQSWREIRAQTTSNNRRTFPKHHAQSTDDVCKDAKDRLAAIGLNEITDALFRFRLGGKRRLWGFIADGVFHAVWWDPEHQVYPTEPNS